MTTLDFTPAQSRSYSESIEQQYSDEREECLENDMDEFQEWLAGKCIRSKPVDLGYVPGTRAPQYTLDRFYDRVCEMSTAELMALALRADSWCALAMRTIRERYIAEMSK